MRIAICDDEQRELEEISRVFSEAARALSTELSITACTSGQALAESVEAGFRPDLILLDVYMEGLGGIETARRLRRAQPGLPLAFLTASREFAVDAFELQALHYIIKPVTVEKAKTLLERLFAQTGRQKPCLELTDRRKEYRFPLESLQYVMSRDKGVEIHLESSPQHSWVACPFREVIGQLGNDPDFLQISRGCVVRLGAVRYIGHGDCHMKNGQCLPIGRREQREVQNRYQDYLFQKMNGAKGGLL